MNREEIPYWRMMHILTKQTKKIEKEIDDFSTSLPEDLKAIVHGSNKSNVSNESNRSNGFNESNKSQLNKKVKIAENHSAKNGVNNSTKINGKICQNNNNNNLANQDGDKWENKYLNNRKNIPCYYYQNGGCMNSHCLYLHSQPEITKKSKKSNIPCIYFKKYKTCNYGDNCNFLHTNLYEYNFSWSKGNKSKNENKNENKNECNFYKTNLRVDKNNFFSINFEGLGFQNNHFKKQLKLPPALYFNDWLLEKKSSDQNHTTNTFKAIKANKTIREIRVIRRNIKTGKTCTLRTNNNNTSQMNTSQINTSQMNTSQMNIPLIRFISGNFLNTKNPKNLKKAKIRLFDFGTEKIGDFEKHTKGFGSKMLKSMAEMKI